MCELTLGSLFDGSGGFPLGGILAGIKPLWASEIEPFAIRVTEKRLPDIKHYGDINGLNGAKLPPVDIITFGSPCQDMSLAGRREGLSGSRSNLFFQAIRIIKEMRCATNDRYPRYIIWENVLGAFSSSKGEDFRAVLESLGESSTRNFGECPNAAVVSFLSDVLIQNAPEKYYLTATACQSIQRNALARGNELPEVLACALHQQIQRASAQHSPQKQEE